MLALIVEAEAALERLDRSERLGKGRRGVLAGGDEAGIGGKLRRARALVTEHEEVHERPALGVEDLALGGLVRLGRRARDRQQLGQEQQRPLAQGLQLPRDRRADEDVIVADDGVAQDLGEAAAEPERQVAADALAEHHVDVRPVGGHVRVEGPAILDLDVARAEPM